MKKIKQAFHRGENVPPSAAQASPYPATTTTTTPLAPTTPAPMSYTTTPLGAPTGPVTTSTTTSTVPLGGPSYATTGLATGLAAPTTVVEQERVIVEDRRPVGVVEECYVREEMIAPAPTVISTAPVLEHREKAPVIQEVIRPGVREEIQPVIHRDREQLEIREEILPIYEKAVRATVFEDRQLAAETRPEVRTGVQPIIAEGPRSETIVEQEHVELITKNPIIEETVHRKIIEEVQPVIHRETIAPKVIREVKPIYEKVIEAPVVTYQTLPPRYQTGTVAQGPEIIEKEVVTTTVIEKEFIPGTANLPGTRGAPMATTTGSYTTTVPYSSSLAPGYSASTPTTYTTEGVAQDMRGMKLEEQQRFGQQPPSTYQYK